MRKPSCAVVVHERGGVELDQLEVGERGARVLGEREAGADRSARVGRALPQGRGAAGGEDGARAALTIGVARRRRAWAPRAGPTQRPSSHQSALAVVPSSTSIRSSLGDERGQLARDAPAGRAAAGVDDAAHASGRPRGRARARRGGRRRSATPSALEVAHRGRRLVAQHPHRARGASAAAGGDRVVEVALGRVVVGERGGDPALGPVAGGLGERRARDEHHAGALARGDERGVEAGGAGADHRDVRARRRRCRLGVHAADYRTGIAPPLYFRHESSLEHDTGPAPRGPGPHPGDRARAGARATGSATSGARRPRSTLDVLDGRPPAGRTSTRCAR